MGERKDDVLPFPAVSPPRRASVTRTEGNPSALAAAAARRRTEGKAQAEANRPPVSPPAAPKAPGLVVTTEVVTPRDRTTQPAARPVERPPAPQAKPGAGGAQGRPAAGAPRTSGELVKLPIRERIKNMTPAEVAELAARARQLRAQRQDEQEAVLRAARKRALSVYGQAGRALTEVAKQAKKPILITVHPDGTVEVAFGKVDEEGIAYAEARPITSSSLAAGLQAASRREIANRANRPS